MPTPTGGKPRTFTRLASVVSEGRMKECKMAQIKRPNWDYWSKLTEVTLWQALLLALDICPHTYHHKHESIGVENQHRYWAYQTIANNEIQSKSVEWVTHKPRGLFSAQDTYVTFALFVKWYLERINVDAPDEFKRLYLVGYNAAKQRGNWIEIARKIALHFILDDSRSWRLTQNNLAKKVANELDKMGIRGERGGVLAYDYVRTQAFTADDWFQKFKKTPNN